MMSKPAMNLAVLSEAVFGEVSFQQLPEKESGTENDSDSDDYSTHNSLLSTSVLSPNGRSLERLY